MSRLSLGVVVFAVCGVSSAHGQCVDQQHEPRRTTSYLVVNNTNFPNDSVLLAGASAWNDASCNTNGGAFPLVTFGSEPIADARFITLVYDPGPNGQVCGTFLGTTITLYGQATLPSGNVVSCGDSAGLAQNFAHELGHAYGLGDSACPGYIMDGIHIDASGSYNERSVQSAECAAVDAMNVTTAESESGASGGCEGRLLEISEDCSPIVINFDQGPYRLTGDSDTVWFDIADSGRPVRVTWTVQGADEAFLWLDRNGNALVDGGAELFGNAVTLSSGARAGNGFEALLEWDENGDRFIDGRDSIWERLMLWRDWNHDGASTQDEIESLRDSAVEGISLDYHWTGRKDANGNLFKFKSTVVLKQDAESKKSTSKPVYDIYFRVVH